MQTAFRLSVPVTPPPEKFGPYFDERFERMVRKYKDSKRITRADLEHIRDMIKELNP